MNNTLRAAAIAALCLSAFAQAQSTGRRPAPARPALVVLVSVDQFRFDYLTRFGPQFKGGLKRLWERGAVFTEAHFEHMPTVTAVGHSILLSGAMPAASGIVANEWYDRESGAQTTSVADAGTRLLGAGDSSGSSPHRLLVSTVGDELKMSGRASKVVGISIKDRSAIMPAGRMADGAYWFDKPSGNFVSSTWYFQALPAWVAAFNQKKAIDQWKGSLDYGKMVESKAGNDVVELFAEAAVEGENLGGGKTTDLLTISFSANDTVGHAKGPDSPEVAEITLHTDVVLDRLFTFLDKRIGMSRVLVVLSADHGVAPLPELQQQRRMPGGRIAEQAVLDAVSKALNSKYGEARWVVGSSGPAPYLDHKLIADSKLDLEEVQNTAAAAVRALPHIARVYTREQLARGQAPNDFAGRRVLNGFYYRRAADLTVVPDPYWLFEDKGTSHGTPWNYDSHVPVVFLGASIKPGKYTDRIQVNDIAPTLAHLLGVDAPSGAGGRVLSEILVR